ncbi:MAG: ABC transporter permease [Caldilineaceae bacterium]
MRKIWLVALATYWRRVRSGAFLGLTLGLPLLMIIAGAVPFWLATRDQAIQTIGIVDQTGELGALSTLPPTPPSEPPALSLVAFADEAVAAAALEQAEIDGYLLIPADYFAGEPPRFYGTEAPNEALRTALASLLRRAQLADAPEWLLARLAEPMVMTYVDGQSGATVAEGPALIVRTFLSSVVALGFALIVFTGVGQMGVAMVREKDQRALEMVITSLSVRELVAGKVLGMSLLSLTQVGIWGVGAAIALALALAGDLALPMISIPWATVLWALLLCVPGYLLYAMLSAGLGIIAGDSQQAQQLAGMLGFFALAPFWLLGVVVSAPDGPLALIFTFFPLTAPMFSLFRMSLTTVPFWQLATALLLILVSLVIATWAVARIFRAVMLLYGQRIRPRTVWQALRSA